MRAGMWLAVGVAVLLSGSGGLAEQETSGCEPVGDIRFICDLIGPEDLAIVPAGSGSSRPATRRGAGFTS